MYDVPHWINGKPIVLKADTHHLFNPATGRIIGHVYFAGQDLVDQAIRAATEAFPTWSQMTPQRRARILFKFKMLLEENIDNLAALVTQEHGKTLIDARGSIQRGIDVVEFVCGIPNLLKGSYAAEVATGVDSYSIRQPLGVCVGITPFNFPAMIPLWMFPLAIACGNTFILKPSEKDPSCVIRFAELAKTAGVPDGVINVLQGNQTTVEALISHPAIKAVSFVGSTAIAEQVYRSATFHGKRVQAFGGAKNHAVVLRDADISQAADAIIGAAYGSAGERCMAISVVVVVGNDLANALVTELKPRIENLKIGAGTELDVEMGPIVTEAHLEKIKSYIAEGLKEGAKIIVDGRALSRKSGFFLGGTLFDHVTPKMRIYQEEIFGPVLSIVRVKNLNEALHLINSHEYGNGTSIFTNDGGAARTFASQVQVGMVGINIPIPVPAALHSFGGWKRSMFGDLHMHGPEGIQFYTKLKTVTQRWLKNSSGSEFSMPTH